MLLGLWLISAPFAFGIADPCFTSDLIVGALLIGVGCLTRRGKNHWASWFGGLLGVWLQFAPLVFWAKEASCYANDTFAGALAIAFSILIPQLGSTEEGPSVPPGWTYNPSSWPQRIPIVLLASIGWFISRYLAAYQLGYIDHIWDPFFGDGTLRVITSDVSKAFPVSDAGLGAMAYSLEALLACKGGERRWRQMPWLVMIFGVLVVPLSLTSIILIILQPTVVGAWCSLCLFTALSMLILVLLGVDEIVAALQYLLRSKEKTFWRRFFEGGSCPGAEFDHRTPSLLAPMSEIIRSAFWGVTFSASLLAAAVLGIVLMLMPWWLGMSAQMSDFDHILGPFIAVASVLAMADVTARVRFFNIAFALLLVVGALITKTDLMVHVGAALVLIFLTFKAPRTV